jgi:hypothetical protein
MNVDKQIEYVTRSEILNLLTDEEAALVATAETRRLPEGDEFIDLEHLDRGVLISEGPTTSSRHVLPRAAVRETTWAKIMTILETPITESRR